jgi:hypothetical protein
MVIKLNGETITLNDVEFSGNENCDHIFINTSFHNKETETSFLLDIDLTREGGIRQILFVNYADNNRHYRTSDFNASETFQIENYAYDVISGSLYFDFSGTLYETNRELNTLQISGKVKMETLKSIDCSFIPWVVKADIDQTSYYAVQVFGKRASEKSEWISYSDSGFKITFLTAVEMKDLPIGVYKFTRNDLLNIVTIQNYTGISKATNANFLLGDEWATYEYEGEFFVEERLEGPNSYTKGTFSVKAYRNDELVYVVKNGSFSFL